jgi:hypothetical protein
MPNVDPTEQCLHPQALQRAMSAFKNDRLRALRAMRKKLAAAGGFDLERFEVVGVEQDMKHLGMGFEVVLFLQDATEEEREILRRLVNPRNSKRLLVQFQLERPASSPPALSSYLRRLKRDVVKRCGVDIERLRISRPDRLNLRLEVQGYTSEFAAQAEAVIRAFFVRHPMDSRVLVNVHILERETR